MGVAGSGKSTLGRLAAQALGWEFYDGDDFHPPENVARMAAGQPLSDRERWPWLERLRQLVDERLAEGRSAILACSALKAVYRQKLGVGKPGVRLAYLRGDYALILQRLQQRQGHFMRPEMLRSQFADLEEPDPGEAQVIEVSEPLEECLARLISWAQGRD